MGRKKIQISRIQDERNRQALQRKEHKSIGGSSQNHCQSPDSDDDSNDASSPGPPPTNGHQQNNFAGGGGGGGAGPQATALVSSTSDLNGVFGVGNSSNIQQQNRTPSSNLSGISQRSSLEQQFPGFLPMSTMNSAAAATNYVLSTQMLHNSLPLASHGSNMKNGDGNGFGGPSSSYGSSQDDNSAGSSSGVGGGGRHNNHDSQSHRLNGRSTSGNGNGGNLRVSIPGGGVSSLNTDQLRVPLSTPTVSSLPGGGGSNLGGYQSTLPSGFSSEFQLTSADLNMLRSLESAALLGSWSAGQTALGIGSNGLLHPDLNLASSAGLHGSNDHHQQQQQQQQQQNSSSNRMSIKSEPASPRTRIEEALRQTARSVYAANSAVVDINGHSAFGDDPGGPPSSKRSRSDTAPPSAAATAAASTVWSPS